MAKKETPRQVAEKIWWAERPDLRRYFLNQIRKDYEHQQLREEKQYRIRERELMSEIMDARFGKA